MGPVQDGETSKTIDAAAPDYPRTASVAEFLEPL